MAQAPNGLRAGDGAALKVQHQPQSLWFSNIPAGGTALSTPYQTPALARRVDPDPPPLQNSDN